MAPWSPWSWLSNLRISQSRLSSARSTWSQAGELLKTGTICSFSRSSRYSHGFSQNMALGNTWQHMATQLLVLLVLPPPSLGGPAFAPDWSIINPYWHILTVSDFLQHRQAMAICHSRFLFQDVSALFGLMWAAWSRPVLSDCGAPEVGRPSDLPHHPAALAVLHLSKPCWELGRWGSAKQEIYCTSPWQKKSDSYHPRISRVAILDSAAVLLI